MPIFKCKMCGGTLEFNQNDTLVTCKYCGVKQALPKLDYEEKKILLDQIENATVDTTALIKRAYLLIEDKKFYDADKYCEKVLDRDPSNVDAYICKLLIEKRVINIDELSNLYESIDTSSNFEKIIRFSNEETRNKFIYISDSINKKIKDDPYSAYLHNKNRNYSSGTLLDKTKNILNQVVDATFDIGGQCYNETKNKLKEMDINEPSDLFGKLEKKMKDLDKYNPFK